MPSHKSNNKIIIEIRPPKSKQQRNVRCCLRLSKNYEKELEDRAAGEE